MFTFGIKISKIELDCKKYISKYIKVNNMKKIAKKFQKQLTIKIIVIY